MFIPENMVRFADTMKLIATRRMLLADLNLLGLTMKKNNKTKCCL